MMISCCRLYHVVCDLLQRSKPSSDVGQVDCSSIVSHNESVVKSVKEVNMWICVDNSFHESRTMHHESICYCKI